MSNLIVRGAFDNIRAKDVPFLEEAAGLGELQDDLWSDGSIITVCGVSPTVPAAERLYIVKALRYVHNGPVV